MHAWFLIRCSNLQTQTCANIHGFYQEVKKTESKNKREEKKGSKNKKEEKKELNDTAKLSSE